MTSVKAVNYAALGLAAVSILLEGIAGKLIFNSRPTTTKLQGQ